MDGTQYSQKILALAPDLVIVIRLRAQGRGKLDFNACTSSLLRFKKTVNGKDELILNVKAAAHVNPD